MHKIEISVSIFTEGGCSAQNYQAAVNKALSSAMLKAETLPENALEYGFAYMMGTDDRKLNVMCNYSGMLEPKTKA